MFLVIRLVWGREYRGNNTVSSGFGGNLPDLGDISNVLGESMISSGEEYRGRSLVDISNVIGRSNSLGEEFRGSKNISREESLGEEGEKFMGEQKQCTNFKAVSGTDVTAVIPAEAKLTTAWKTEPWKMCNTVRNEKWPTLKVVVIK